MRMGLGQRSELQLSILRNTAIAGPGMLRGIVFLECSGSDGCLEAEGMGEARFCEC